MNQRLQLLLEKYFEGALSHDELADLAALMDEEGENGISEWLEKEWNDISGSTGVFDHEESETMLQQIISRRPGKARVIPLYKRKWFRAVAAAVVVLMMAGTIWWQNSTPGEPQTVRNEQEQQEEIVPGSNKAVLTLADGSQITLDDVADGNIATQANTAVVKHDGQLVYQEGGKAGEVVFNTISTPRGGMYMLELTDGSKVWLNSSSSIRYPNRFAGAERKVEISGEVYFEVAHNATMPFRVQVAGKGLVEVLGTHFNINAYHDEPTVNTTLLEGSVRFTEATNNVELVLKPGQQSVLKPDGTMRLKGNVNTESVVAWKTGVFDFSGQEITAIMRQISRWYDVEVVFSGTVSHETFSGIISRNSSVEEVIDLMAQGGVRSRISGRKIYVEF